MQPPNPAPARSTVYGRSVLVILGWYATIVAAAVVGATSLPTRPTPTSCSSFCLSSSGDLVRYVVIVIVVPVFLASMAVALGVLAALVRRVRSATLAGSIAAAAPIAVGAVILLFLRGQR